MQKYTELRSVSLWEKERTIMIDSLLRAVLESDQAKEIAAASGHSLGAFLAELLGPMIANLL